MSITIRKARLGDEKLLAKLNMSVHQPHVAAQPERYKALTADNPELIAIFKNRFANETIYTFIAENDTQAVGYVHCFLNQKAENPFVYSQLDFHIDQIAVIESHQGQGIGNLLMQHAMQIAKDCRADVVTLGVVAFNEGAIRFYEKLGFSIGSYRMSKIISDK